MEKEYVNRSGRRVSTIGLLLLLLLLSANNLLAQTKWEFNGTFGLYIGVSDGNATIKWITNNIDEGFVEVTPKDGTSLKATTAAYRTHTYEFKVGNTKEYEIVFGALNDKSDRHTIWVDLAEYDKREVDQYHNVDSLFVMSDIHGEYWNVRNMLIAQGVINENEDWTGGSAHLVVVGDIFDRGPDVTKLLWFLYELEHKASLSGGMVNVMLGNHEIMTFSNDLRFLSAKESSTATTLGMTYHEMYDVSTSVLAKWLMRKPTILKIDNVLFTHGGMITNYADFDIEVFNDSVYRFMQEPQFKVLGESPLDTIHYESEKIKERQDFFYGIWTPYWFRGYVETDTLQEYLDVVLENYDARLHVVGHTMTERIGSHYKGKLIAMDVPKKGTEMLLLVRKGKKKYRRFRLTIDGQIEELTK